MTTVIVILQPTEGRTDELVAWLKTNHARVRTFPGFRSIKLLRDERGVIEIEHWEKADDHRAMVDACDWSELDPLLECEAEIRYLEHVSEIVL